MFGLDFDVVRALFRWVRGIGTAHLLVGAASLLLGYAAGFALFEKAMVGDSEWAQGVTGDLGVQLTCCVPVLLSLVPPIAALAALPGHRLQTAPSVTLALTGVASAIAGFALYVPFQYLLMFFAAF